MHVVQKVYMADRRYDYPVFATQGGGLVREVSRNPYRYIFVEKPDCPGLDVGDYMPEQWDIVPVNQTARDLIAREQFDDTDPLFQVHRIIDNALRRL